MVFGAVGCGEHTRNPDHRSAENTPPYLRRRIPSGWTGDRVESGGGIATGWGCWWSQEPSGETLPPKTRHGSQEGHKQCDSLLSLRIERREGGQKKGISSSPRGEDNSRRFRAERESLLSPDFRRKSEFTSDHYASVPAVGVTFGTTGYLISLPTDFPQAMATVRYPKWANLETGR
jgi:hypothetical protein